MKLNGTWTLYYAPEGKFKNLTVTNLHGTKIPRIPCTVPGNVELDLSAAGILPTDLFKGENILQAEAFEHYEWWYETNFTAPEKPNEEQEMILHFRGVDCYADYYLNGTLIGSSDNMFIAHEFNVTEQLIYGHENTLIVHISSAVLKGVTYPKEPMICHFTWHQDTVHVHTRKPPHCYGWDIMPRAVSAGIWRDVTLECREKYRFRYVLFHVDAIESDKIRVHMAYDTTILPRFAFRDTKMIIHGKCGDSEFTHQCIRRINAGRVDFVIHQPKLWWPKHYGTPNLYDITVTICDMDNNKLMETKLRQGFRTLELDRTDIVTEGGRFQFVVNGKKIMVVGSNWVPLDAYHSRDHLRLLQALELANDIGCNILRCWGGNVYEDHPFFNYCDEHGILVWQDFSMACNAYPLDDDFLAKLKKEAQWVISEYRHHCSIALWSGDNEIDQLISGKKKDPVFNRITREILPQIVDRFDPYRSYIASSPYISSEAYKLGAKYYPEDHLWGPRDYFKSNYYSQSNAYFVSETGYHGCPDKSSIEKFIDANKVWPYQNNEQWNLHSTDQYNSNHRTMLMHKQVQQLFGEVPTDMDDYILASQISQAEAKKYFIERVRCKMNSMGGVIWWNLLDGWPQMSDAVVDYYFTKKLAYNYIKRSSRDFIIMMGEMASWCHRLICSNMSFTERSGHCRVINLETGDEIFHTAFVADANKNTTIGTIQLMYSTQTMMLIQWRLDDGKEYYNTYLCGMPGFSLEKYKNWLEKLPE